VIHVVDWEQDGDQDLLVGDIEGKIQVIRNASGDRTFKVGQVDRLSAGGTPISTPGRNSGPVVADWDGDGKTDLLVGCGDGSVQFFRNSAEGGEPVLAAPVTLIPKPTGTALGYRAKLAVIDWNGDGKQDLLVGDFSSVAGKAPELTTEQFKKKADLEAQQQALSMEFSKKFGPLSMKWIDLAREELGLSTEKSWGVAYRELDAETRQKVIDTMAKHREADPLWPEYSRAQADMQKVSEELRKLPRATRSSHGFVWLFVRK
jgi:hypothetical protein